MLGRLESYLVGHLKFISLKLGRLQLASQFTLLLLLIFVSGIALGGFTLSKALEHKAIAQMNYRGRMVMQMVNAVSDRTSDEIVPLIAQFTDPQTNLIPAAIPSLAAKQVFDKLRENWEYKDFIYKPATLNPTNLDDQANLFEAKLIEKFIQDAPQGTLNRHLKTLSGFHVVSGKKLFYTAKPLIVNNPNCLQCHGTPENAPKSHVKKYGTQNGYGWKLNQVIGSQIVYIPASEVFLSSRRALFLFIAIFISIFALVIVSMNYLLKWRVIKPLKPMSQLAEIISQEKVDINQIRRLESRELTKIIKRRDELGKLGRVFQNMVYEVCDRQKQMEYRERLLAEQIQQLRVEIDHSEITREVDEISQSDYFQKLQETAKEIREGR
ncbi:MAG: DUF3365 domain-containing protein [Cyanobacteria bacterium P01_A01_bin.84]